MLTNVIQINKRANPASFRFARTNCGLVSGIVFARETFGLCRTPLDRKRARDLVTSNVRGIIEAPDLAGQQHEGQCDLKMKKADLFTELVATYAKHGWQLKSVLMKPSTRVEIISTDTALLDSIRIEEASVDALWFSRPSHEKREAWELRLMAETQYALFETFEADETEEQRDEARREMEARLREYVSAR